MATDQEIRNAGLLYIPQQKYLQNPYNLPIAPVPPTTPPGGGGITNTNAFNNSGNEFSVYNPDPNSIVNRNADSTRYNNLMENSFLKGGSNSTDPRYLTERYNPSITRDQSRYNLASQNISMNSMTPERRAEVMRDTNNKIQDNRQTYGAQGQFETVPSEFAYNSQTKLNKFKDNYPEYFGLDQSGPKTGIPGLMEKYMTNSFLGKGAGMAKDFLGNILPTNKRAMLENQLGAGGVMVNDIGQIVQGEGSYDDASGRNVMAGYNASKMTAETFDKRLSKIAETMGKKGYKGNLQKRVDAIEAAKTDFLKSKKESDFMYGETEEEKNKKKKKGNIITRFLTKKKETKAAGDAQAAEAAEAAAQAEINRKADIQRIQSRLDDTGVTGSNYNQAANERGGGGGNTATNSQGQTAREATYDNDKSTGTAQSYSQHYAKGGRAGYFFGGRVNYKIGGRVSFKNGGLASIL